MTRLCFKKEIDYPSQVFGGNMGIHVFGTNSLKAGVGKLRPAKVFRPARRALFKKAYTDFSHRWIELHRERTVLGFYLVHLVGKHIRARIEGKTFFFRDHCNFGRKIAKLGIKSE